MFKNSSLVFIRWKVFVLVLMVIGVNSPAYCQENGAMLLLQQTPVQGGTVTPNIGIHNFELNEEVTLTAVPQPGYQFVYWIGNVSEPTANNTSVYLDGSKIVIAVFERSKYDFLSMEAEPKSTPFGGLRASARDYSQTGYAGGGAKRPHKPTVYGGQLQPEPEPEPEPNDFPVPEPVPEPTTLGLLALGSLGLLRKRKLKNKL